MFLNMIMSIKEKIISINGRSQTNRDSKPNLLFLQQHDQSQKFWAKLKIDKNHIKTLIFTALDILQLKKLMIMKVLTVQILCKTDMSKNKMEYLIFDTTDENKELLKKYKDVWNGIKNKI